MQVGGNTYSLGVQAGSVWPNPDEMMEHADGKLEFYGIVCNRQTIQGDATQVDTYYLPIHPQQRVLSDGIIPMRILHMCQRQRHTARTFTLWKGPVYQRTGRVVVRHIGDELVIHSQQRLEVVFNFDGRHYDVQILGSDFKVNIKFGDRVVFTRETGDFQVDYFGWDIVHWKNLGRCTRERLTSAAPIMEPEPLLPPHIRAGTTEKKEKKKLPPPLVVPYEDKEDEAVTTPTPTEAPSSPPNVKVRRREMLQEKQKKRRSRSESPKARRSVPGCNKKSDQKDDVGPATINNLAEVPLLQCFNIVECMPRPVCLSLENLLLHHPCVVRVGSDGSPCVILPPMCGQPVLTLNARMLRLAVQEVVRTKVGWKEDPTPYNLTCGQLLACTSMVELDKFKLKAHILDVIILLLGA